MDGPSVNWNVLDIVSEKRNEFEQLLIIGSFSQHVLYGVFKNGVTITKWDFISRLILQLEETFTCVKEKLLYFRWDIFNFQDLLPYVCCINYLDYSVEFSKHSEYILFLSTVKLIIECQYWG